MSFPGSTEDLVQLFALTLKVSGGPVDVADGLEQRFLHCLALGRIDGECLLAFKEHNPYLMWDVVPAFLDFTADQMRAAYRQGEGMPVEHLTHALWMQRDRIRLDASLKPIGIRSQP